MWKKPEIYSLNIGRIIVTNINPLGSLFISDSQKKSWATGPVCHSVDKSVVFYRPIPATGRDGMWRIGTSDAERVIKETNDSFVRSFDPLPRLPRG